MIRNKKRLGALLLSAALIVTQLPAVAMAENATPEDGSIASFEELPSGVAKQTVDVGTELSELNLPDMVTATIYHVTEDMAIPDKVNGGDLSTATPSDADVSVSDNSSGDSSDKDSGTTVTTVTTSTEEIPVTWDSEPDYDGDTAGSYVFTADVGGYVLSAGAKPPQITVTVSWGAAVNPTVNLPTELPPASNGLVKTITGWTFVDDENLNEGVLPLINASMEHQADFDTVVSMLPTQISAALENTTEPVSVDIIGWNCPEYVQDGEGNWPLTGNYIFSADLPEGYACDPLPEVKVLLGGGNLYSNEYSGLTITGGAVTQDADGQIKLTDDNGNYTITGTWTGTLAAVNVDNKKAVITVPDSVTANVILKNVSIDTSGQSGAGAFAVAVSGTANITLSGTNTLTSGKYRAGLEVPENAKVMIDGSGSLTANGGGFGAGIGGGYGCSGGTITINGGMVEANSGILGGGAGGAGIGGGGNGGGGIITINGGTVTANSIHDGAGIGGGGSGCSGGIITINGGTVKAYGGVADGNNSGAGIGGSGETIITINGGTVEASGGSEDMDLLGGAGIGGDNGGTITISGGTVKANGGSGGAGIGGSDGRNGGTITINGGRVEANGGYKGAGIGGGIGGSAGTIEISGNADVTATGGDDSAGIGGDSGGNITISGGTVNANGGGGIHGRAGIGGAGWDGSGGDISISGGIIYAEGGTGELKSGAGIGGGGSPNGTGTAGNITINGNAVVFAKGGRTGVNAIGSGEGSSDMTAPTLTQGVVFEDSDGAVYGSSELPGDVTIPNGSTLIIPNGSTLTVPDGITLDNEGAIINNGTIDNYGTITGNQPSGGTINSTSTTVVTFAVQENGIYGNAVTTAMFGDTVKITAAAQRKVTNTLARGAAQNEVDFYIGSIAPEHKLGTATATTSNSTATATLVLTLSDPDWDKGFALGENTIIADFGRVNALNLLDSIGTANLTVERELSDAAAGISAPATGAAPDTTATVDGSAGYTAGRVTWSGTLTADGKFDYDTAYTAEITLNTKQYYRFANPVTGTINGQTASVSCKNDTEVVLSYTFDKTGPQTWAVTIENGTSDKTAAAEGETVTITADNAPSGKVFERWTADSTDIIFDNPNSVSTSFIMPEHAVTVTANFKDKPSGGGSSSSSGGSSYFEPEPQSSYTAAGDNISQTISRYDIKKLEDSGKSLTLRCDKTGMTFEPAALKAILAAVPSTAGNITFTAAPADLSAFPEAAKLIGTHPVYNFTISYKDNNGTPITVLVNFLAGSASITLAYTPAAAEVTGSLFMVYVDSKGAVTWLDKSSYKVNDAEGDREGALGRDNGKMLAEVPHFSTYGVAYKTPVPEFADIAGHWAKEDIEFVAARGLLSGMGNNLFSPDGTMTRGMFVTALGRLAGVNPDSYKTRSFTDVKADACYAAYVEWAAQKNIVKGTGDKLFSPDTPVTREQMAVMMVDYAGQTGYSIPTPLAAVTFADNDKISAWAVKEVAAMQRAGIIKGKDGNRFDPQASATRAEVSAVLRRFVEIVIDPATATASPCFPAARVPHAIS